MEPTPKKSHPKRETIFRIIVCILAIFALSAAITYMIRGIITDTNATKRLLAEAFMSYQNQSTAETTAASDSTEKSASAILPEKIPLVSADLSSPNAAITNYTSYTIDETALKDHKFTLYSYGKSPLVLILHSHVDECYASEGATQVDSTFNFENTDQRENVFAVGEAIAEVLTATGIGAVHISEEITDPDETIARYLALYPSIRFVLDVHRDGMYTTDGRIVRTDGKVANTPAAQLMLAVGTGNAASASGWQENLAAAYRLASMMSSAEKNIMRKVLLRPEGLYQSHAPCSLSLYVGSTGNTLSEALTSARFFARYYAIFILSAATT